MRLIRRDDESWMRLGAALLMAGAMSCGGTAGKRFGDGGTDGAGDAGPVEAGPPRALAPCPAATLPDAGWIRVPTGYPGAGLAIVYPGNPRLALLFESKGDPKGVAGPTTTLFRTPDGGQTWCQVGGLEASGLTPLFPPSAPTTVYLLDTSGSRLLLSFDGGGTFETIRPAVADGTPLPGSLFAIHPDDESVLYAIPASIKWGGPAPLFRSEDHGRTWNAAPVDLAGLLNASGSLLVPEGLFPSGGARETVVVKLTEESPPLPPGNRVALVRWDVPGNSIVRLQAPSRERSAELVFDRSGRLFLATGELYTLARDATMFDRVALPAGALGNLKPLIPALPGAAAVWLVTQAESGHRLYRTADAGKTWTAGESAPGLALTAVSDDRLFWLERTGTGSTGTRIHETLDAGRTWSRRVVNHVASGTFLLARGGRVLLANAGSLLRSEDGFRSWTGADRGFWNLEEDPTDPDRLYGSGSTGGAFTSADGGKSWQPWTITFPGTSDQGQEPGRFLALAIASNGTMLARVSGRVFRSADRGASWTPVLDVIDEPLTPRRNLAFAPSDPMVAFAADVGAVHRSLDGGLTWQAAAVPAPGAPMYANRVFVVVIHPQDPSRVFAAGQQGLFRSTDGGVSWRRVSESWPAEEVETVSPFVVFDPRRPEHVYVASPLGVRLSEDGGESWGPMPDGPGRASGLVIDPETGTFYAQMVNDVLRKN
jgi:photosystem II stability/assembly factor-like uncharacterized protein